MPPKKEFTHDEILTAPFDMPFYYLDVNNGQSGGKEQWILTLGEVKALQAIKKRERIDDKDLIEHCISLGRGLQTDPAFLQVDELIDQTITTWNRTVELKRFEEVVNADPWDCSNISTFEQMAFHDLQIHFSNRFISLYDEKLITMYQDFVTEALKYYEKFQ